MGSYLDSPNTEKLSTPVFLNKRLRYVATAMQGLHFF